MLNIVIVDDEKLARNRIRDLIDELEVDVQVLGEAANGKEAVEIIRSQSPDLVLLDIQMPVLDGFDVVDLLGSDRPDIIFITAFDEYALKAFEIHAVDYLLKPVRKERLSEALNRVDKREAPEEDYQAIDDLVSSYLQNKTREFRRIPINYKKEIRFVDYEEVCYFEADGKITWVHTDDGEKYRTDFTLKDLEQRLRSQLFLRIHRSRIVNLKLVKKLEPWFKDGFRLTMKNGTTLDVARRRVKDLKSQLGIE